MKISGFVKLTTLIAFVAALSSCGEKKPHFTIEGTIGDADSTTMYLERRSLSETIIIDSVKLDKDGSFKMEVPAIDHSEFYRLKLDKQIINLAIDSTETITVNAPKPTFAVDYTVTGSEANNKIKTVTLNHYKLNKSIENLNRELVGKKITHDLYIQGLASAIGAYKEQAQKTLATDFASLSSYYILFQKVDGYLIFDPMDKNDLKLFRAVATAWDQKHANSDRTKHLHDYTLTAVAQTRQLAQNEKALTEMLEKSATSTSTVSYDIALPNIKGEIKNLSASNGKVTILDFSAYNTEYSPAHNVLLHEVYKQLRGEVEIYQVSFDDNLHAWQNTAENLPWICVRDNKSLNSELIRKFNIFNLPTTYIVDKNGAPIKRILPTDDILKEVNKLK